MKELRFHGRGGQGVVTGAQILVQAVVNKGEYAHFIPYFGVERKGSPVFGYVRLDDKDIRQKTQVYKPDCVVIFDDTLMTGDNLFEGLSDDGVIVINTTKSVEELDLPGKYSKIGLVDATTITMEAIKRNTPNAAMLGALAKTTGWVNLESLLDSVEETFGSKNREVTKEAYENTKVI